MNGLRVKIPTPLSSPKAGKPTPALPLRSRHAQHARAPSKMPVKLTSQFHSRQFSAMNMSGLGLDKFLFEDESVTVQRINEMASLKTLREISLKSCTFTPDVLNKLYGLRKAKKITFEYEKGEAVRAKTEGSSHSAKVTFEKEKITPQLLLERTKKLEHIRKVYLIGCDCEKNVLVELSKLGKVKNVTFEYEDQAEEAPKRRSKSPPPEEEPSPRGSRADKDGYELKGKAVSRADDKDSISGLEDSDEDHLQAKKFDVVPAGFRDILRKRLQGADVRVDATELEAFYSEYETAFKADEDIVSISKPGEVLTTSISRMVLNYERSHGALVKAWRSGRAWIDDIASPELKPVRFNLVCEGLQSERVSAIEMIGNIADEWVFKHFSIPRCDFQDNGTFSIFSDVDYAAVINSRSFKANALQGIKAAYENVVWRALFKKSAGLLADCNFYCPQIATYFTRTPEYPAAQALSSRASLMGSLLQLRRQAPKELAELYINSFHQVLEERAKNPCVPEERTRANQAIKALKECIADIESFEAAFAQMNRAQPDGETAVQDAIVVEFSYILAELGDKIDKELNEKVRDQLMALYYFFSILRERALPEGFFTKGAFEVVCKDKGSQLHQKFHERLEQRQVELMPQVEATFKESTPQARRDAIAEITAFFAHKKDLIEASKSGERATKSALVLINLLITQNEELRRKMTGAVDKPLDFDKTIGALERDHRYLQELLKFANEQLSRMAILLATKRGEWNEGSFVRAFRTVSLDISVGRYEQALKALDAQKSEILIGSSSAAIIEAFFNAFQKLFGLPVEQNRFFTLEKIRTTSGSRLAKYLPVPGAQVKTLAILDSDKDNLWNALKAELGTLFSMKQKVDERFINEVATKIFGQATKGSRNFEPQHERRINKDGLKRELAQIISQSIDDHGPEGELFKLAETVQKTGRIAQGRAELSQKEYAEKELARLKSELSIRENGELLKDLQVNMIKRFAQIDALSMVTGLIATPEKPDDMPTFTQALMDSDSLRKYFEAYHVTLKLTMLSVEAQSPLNSARQYSGSSSSPMSPSPQSRKTSPKFLRWKDIDAQAEDTQTQIEQAQIAPQELLRRGSLTLKKPPLSPGFRRSPDVPIPGLILNTPKKSASKFDFVPLQDEKEWQVSQSALQVSGASQKALQSDKAQSQAFVGGFSPSLSPSFGFASSSHMVTSPMMVTSAEKPPVTQASFQERFKDPASFKEISFEGSSFHHSVSKNYFYYSFANAVNLNLSSVRGIENFKPFLSHLNLRFPKLESLDLRRTNILSTTLFSLFLGASNLKRIDLSHNPLLDLSAFHALCGAPNLREIIITGCPKLIHDVAKLRDRNPHIRFII